MNITNLEVVQSYILTMSRYNYSVHEKRIFYRIVEMLQQVLEGKKLSGKYRFNKLLFDLFEVEMPISSFLIDERDKNHALAKKALISLETKYFDYEDANIWKRIRIIERPQIDKNSSIVKFRLNGDIYNALMDFSKGYRRYELDTAFMFESAFTMRFYELFSEQKSAITYSIESLKLTFGVQDKYKLTADFIKRVIVPAQQELNKKSPYSFEFQPLKTGKRITAIKFFPVFIAENVNNETERKRLQKQISASWTIERTTIQYLKEHFMFSEVELRHNIELFEAGQDEIPDFILWLSEVKARANRKTNPKGYLINALKSQITQNDRTKRRSKKASENPQINDVINNLANSFKIK